MSASSCVLAALVALLAMCSSVMAYTGEGTAYSGDYEKDRTGKNACGFGNLGSYFEKYYAARPLRGFKKSDCGRCIKARGLERGAPGKWVKVMIIDQCAGCKGGDVDFSSRALKEITGFEWDRKRIEWEYTDCGSDVSTSSKKKKSKGKKKSKKNRRGRKNRG